VGEDRIGYRYCSYWVPSWWARGGGGSWLELTVGSWDIRHGLVLRLVRLFLVILLVTVICRSRARTIRSSLHLLHRLEDLPGVHWIRSW